MDKKTLFKTLGGIGIDLLVVAGLSFAAIKIAYSYSKSIYFVDGRSMYPTLNGETSIEGGSYFGEQDNSKQAINRIERFDIVTTYYNFDYDDFAQPYQRNAKPLETATLKIKRVIGIPGDTININGDYFSISFVDNKGNTKLYEFDTEGTNGRIKCPFGRFGDSNNNTYYLDDWEVTTVYDEDGTEHIVEKPKEYSIEEKYLENFTLGEDEYFIMGDNWTLGGSKDSYSTNNYKCPHSCIYKECIKGVILNAKGACTVQSDFVCSKCHNKNSTDSIKCVYCGDEHLHYEAELKDMQYFKKVINLKGLWRKYIGSLGI